MGGISGRQWSDQQNLIVYFYYVDSNLVQKLEVIICVDDLESIS